MQGNGKWGGVIENDVFSWGWCGLMPLMLQSMLMHVDAEAKEDCRVLVDVDNDWRIVYGVTPPLTFSGD